MTTHGSADGRHRFQSAVEAKDLDAVIRTLREDVVFHTPLRFAPFEGRDQAIVAMTLAAQAFVFQPGFRYTRTFREGSALALFFEAQIRGKALEGVDLLVLDDQDKVAELRVLMRPFTAVRELVSLTGSLLESAHGSPPAR
ncbi:nuclear transport factor 2 family protein [Nocardia abscessus]|uniref:Nuclear transport factor 2 family protein n=1 Tax=Nocardia abscessus TaxID=120957 RepID=A0ABS0CGT9_9NOCA|nr:nuclear transport factor 2 family protein [Nocardia abscessus]MBF6227804.1 nuclear transport factor 2 family protein [Nocardia abscessus]